jgi:hypothetical protein
MRTTRCAAIQLHASENMRTAQNKKIFEIILAIIIAGGFYCEPLLWADQRDLSKANWSVSTANNLATNPPSNNEILTFIEKLRGLEGAYLQLCSAQFADLRHSGNLSLVASWSDGRFCDVEIFDKSAAGFEVYDVDDSRRVEVKDVDGNATLQVIADVDLTVWAGSNHCQASWPVIYTWTGDGYEDVSSKYRPFYAQRLDSLNKEIAVLSSAREQTKAIAINQEPAPGPTTNRHSDAESVGGFGGHLLVPEVSSVQRESPVADATPASKPNPGNADCLKAEAAKIERFLGSADAGMNDSVEWANSENPWTRDFASETLFDIGTPEAIRYLQTLSKDTNPMVAGTAKNYLEELTKGDRPTHQIEKLEDLSRGSSARPYAP